MLAACCCPCPIVPPAARPNVGQKNPEGPQEKQAPAAPLEKQVPPARLGESDFAELEDWCARSWGEVVSLNRSNPIRGKELMASRLEQFRAKVVGKEVRLKFRVLGIINEKNQKGLLIARKNRGGLLEDENAMENRPGSNFHPNKTRGVNWFFDDLPLERLRELNVGQDVTVVGRITDVIMLGRVKLSDAKIE